MTPGERFAAKIEGDWLSHMKSIRSPQSVAPTNRASTLGDVCERRLVLYRTKGDQAAQIDPTLQSIFEEGKLHERETKRLLSDLGYDLIGAQQSFPKNDYNITGHIDGVLSDDGVPFVAEVKSLNPNSWVRIKTIDDIRYSGASWMKKWFDQAQLYCVLSGIDRGIFILKNKSTGEIKVIPFELDHEAVESLLDRAVRIENYIKLGELPEPITSPRECSQCPFFQRVCFPQVNFGEGMAMIMDEDLIEMAEQRDRHAEGHRLYKEADEVLKERLRGVERGLLGEGFAIIGRWQKKTITDIPKELLSQYQTVNPKGTFVLKIEKLGDSGANGPVEIEGGQ